MRTVRKDWRLFILVGALILIVGVGFLVKFGIEHAAEEALAKFPDRGVPRMNISLNGVMLEEINAGMKETRYEGNEVTVYEGNEKTLEADGVRVKGRGNGSWVHEKKPYQIKFSKKVDLFGLGKAKKWILLANAADGSNFRTDIAFTIAKELGMDYTLDGRFVELYVDNDYVGLYYLTHMISVDKGVVDLKDPTGVLVELDNIYGIWEERFYVTNDKTKLVLKDIKNKEYAEVAMSNFVEDYNELNRLVEKKDYEGVMRIIDVESFAQYYLLSEFIVNPDAYWTSFFMYKDGINDKIHAGPAWDFDIAFGNKKWGNWQGEDIYSPTITMVRKRELQSEEFYNEHGIGGGYDDSMKISRLVFNLMEIPEFKELVDSIYQERFSGKIEEIVSAIKNKAYIFRDALNSENDKWDKGDAFSDLEAISNWMMVRANYFEKEYGKRQ